MARKFNHERPYRDPDPTRVDVSKEQLPRYLAPNPDKILRSETPLPTLDDELGEMISRLGRHMVSIDARIALWMDNKRRCSSPPGACDSRIAELETLRSEGIRILENLRLISARKFADASGQAVPDLFYLRWSFNDFEAALGNR